MVTEAGLSAATGLALLLVGILLVARAKAPAGRWLGLFVIIDGLHGMAHGAPSLASDPRLAQTILNTFHVPSFFGFAVGVAFVTSFTGIHQQFWRRPAAMAALLVVPFAMLALELALPSPFWVMADGGPHDVAGNLGHVASAYGFLHLAFDLYFVAVSALALSRARRLADLPGLAILLAVLVTRNAPVVISFASDAARWSFLPAAPPLLGHSWLLIPLVAVVSMAPMLLVRRRFGPAWSAALAACALAALVTATLQAGSTDRLPLTNLRPAFEALLLLYAAFRHGLLGRAVVGPPAVEYPVMMLGFAATLVLCVTIFGSLAPPVAAVGSGIGVAASVTVLLGAISNTPFSSREQAAYAPTGLRRAPRLINRRFVVQESLGAGARARSYLAYDVVAGRRVAMKIVPPGGHRAAFAQRAAAAMSDIHHPNVVVCHGLEQTPLGPATVAAFCDAGNLAAVIQSGPQTRARWIDIADGALAGLDAIHAAGYVHGNLKPNNVLVGDAGHPILSDLGILPEPDEAHACDAGWLATLRYTSPECAQGKPVGPASDQYSLAVVLYELASGQPLVVPLGAEDAATIRGRVARAAPFLGHPALPADVAAWLAVALHPDPEQRFRSVAHARQSLPR